jgi:hypothetical protein
VWWKGWLVGHRERRDSAREYRRARRNWVREHVRARLRLTALLTSLSLGIGGVLVYWTWARWRGTEFEPVRFWALVIPPIFYAAGTWMYYRMRAPAQLFQDQREQIELHQPRVPWAVAVDVDEAHRRIMVRLTLRDGSTGTTMIDSATCFFAIEAVRPACRTPKSGEVGEGKTIEWEYPLEFEPPIWPIPDGEYEAVVDKIASPSFPGTVSTGEQFRIGPRKRRRR